MRNFYLKFLPWIVFSFVAIFAYSEAKAQQAVVSFTTHNSCGTSDNGSIDFVITGTAPLSIRLVGINTGTFIPNQPVTSGVPITIPSLPADDYVIIVFDGDPSPNYSSSTTIISVTPISGINTTVVNNSDQTCLTPNGSITINSVTGGSGTYNFLWGGPGGFTSTSQSISNLKGGDYIVSISDQTANCTFTSAPIHITDPLPSTFTISSPDVFLCNGENLVIDINPSVPTNGIQYTLYDGATAVGTTITWPTSQIVYSGLTTGLHSNIRVEGKLTGSICTPIFSTNTLSVNLSSPPTAATLTLVGATPICAGQSSSIQANITGGSAPYSFTINGLGLVSGYNGSPIPVSPAATTTYSFGSVITDNNGCTVAGTGSFQVVVNPLPTATISGGGPVCASDPLPDVIFTFTGTAPFDFTYSDGVNPPVVVTGHNSTTYTIPTAPVGTYSITALSDANTCVATNLGTPVTSSVNPLPTASVSGGATVCANALPTITFTFTGTAPFDFTYTDGINPPVAVTGHPTTTFFINNAPAGTYSVTALIDFNGCVATSFGTAQQVIVNPLPTATISGGGPVCASDPLPDVIFTFTGTAPFDFTYSDGVNPPVVVTGHNSTTYTIPTAPVGTYSITALSDANTCVATNLGTPVTSSVNPLPTASVSGGATVCANALPTITFTFTGTAPFDFTYTDGINPPVAVTGHPTTTFFINNAPAGTYSVTALIDFNGCVATSFGTAQQVIVNPLPTAAISGGGSVCTGNPLPNVIFTFTGTAPFDFTYSDGVNPPVVVTGHNSTTYTIPTAPVGTYTIIALSDANTCNATALGTPVSVSNQVLPTASAGGGTTLCAGDPLPTITFTFTGTSPFNFTYTDGVNPPVVVTGHATSTYTIPNAPAGSYSITSLSDANCTGTSFGSSADVIVNPSPDVVISGGGIVCPGNPQPDVTFTFTGTAPFDFTYNDGTNPAVSVVAHPTNVFTISAAAVGTYTITSFNDATSCAALSLGTPVSVSNQVLPTASASGGTTICAGDPLPTITFTFTGTSPFNFTYTDGVNPPVVVTGHATSTYTIPNAPAGSYSITSLSDANCTGTSFGSSADVIVNPSPDVVITGGGIVCPGNPQPDVTFTFTGTGPFDFTYNDGTNPAVSVVAHPTNVFTISAAAVGTYTITSFNDATSCAALSLGTPVSVSNQVLPTASASGGTTICAGDPLPTITFTFTGTSPFNFTYTDGVNPPVVVTGHATSTYTIPNAPAGSYSITSLSDANCTGTSFGSSADVIVNPSPDVVITGGGIVCPGNPQPDVTFTFTGTGPFDFTYNDGTNPAVSIVAHPTNVFTISAAAVGTYTITSFNDATSCAALSLGTPVSVSNQVLPTASASGGTTICAGDPLPTITFTFTGTAPFNFTYTDGVNPPVVVTGHATSTYTIPNAPAGSYSITALSDANCTGTSFGSSADVIVAPTPIAPTVTFDATPICIGSAITAPVIASPVGTSTYTWYSDAALTTSLTTGTAPTNAQLNFSSATANVTTVYVTETNATTCEGLATSVTLSVSDIPTAELIGNAAICQGTSTDLTLVLTGIGPWDVSYSDGTSTFTIPNITSSPFPITVSPAVGTTTYNLISVTNAACGAGTVSGTPSVAVTAIGGDEITFGTDTWIGYVYTNATAPSPPLSNIDFASSKYRGYIDETDISGLGTSSYNTTTDRFDLNVGNSTPVSGSNVCGSYLENYSIRFKMRKVFAAGEYRFTIGGDDGVRLFRDVSGTLTPITLSPSGSFNPHSYTTYTSGIVCLSGSEDLVLEYYEQSGFSRVSFNYTYAVPLVDAIAPVSACVNQTPAPTLTANSTTPGVTVTGYNWYTDATLLNKVATTAAYTPSATELDLTIANSKTFYATASYSCGEGPATAVVVNVINSVNTALTVAPTIDPVCSGGVSGIKITASEAGVSYQLINDLDNSLVGSAVVGTGGDITLPTGALTITTTFRIAATAGTCSVVLTTKPTVNVSGTVNAALTVTPLTTAVCAGTGTDIQVFNSESGITYQLRNDADDSLIGTPVAGTGLAAPIALPTGNLNTLPSVTFNILASNGTCSIELTATATVNVDTAPDISLAVNSDVTGTLCIGGSANITVDLSEAGVSYQLRDDSNDSPIGSPVVGNGAKIDLPTGALSLTTTFNVLATNGACTPVELTATKTINVAGSVALNLSVTPVDAVVCTGSATTIEIANSEVGVTYQLRNEADDSLIGAAVAGTGSATVPLSLPTGNLITLPSITFNVLASSVTCSAELTNKTTVTVGTNPDATLAVTVPPATLCVNGFSSVTVVNSETGVSYQLRNDADDSLIGSVVAGTGADITLPTGSLAATTTFNVLASSGVCTPVELNATATVNVGGTIADNLSVTANSSSICSGTATTIDVAGSDATVTYQLRDNTTNALIGAALAGNGGILNLPTGNLAANTTFNVLASNGTCSIQLTTTASVTITTAPSNALGVTAQNPTLCTTNTGTNIRIANSENGIPYQLRDGATNIGAAVTGTGATIDLPTGTLAATTTFNVFAGTGTCSVQLATTVTVTIISTPAINLGVTAQSATLCTTNTGTNIQVANSENGVSYQLRDGATNIGTPVTGTGATIDLPTGTLSATTTFNVFASVGTCSAQLTATAIVTITSTPDISLGVTAQSATLCTTNTGTNIQVANSQTGVSYQLRDGAINIGAPVNGTGGTISLPTGSLTATTTYNVFASLGATCSAQLTATATVTVTSTPDITLGVTAQNPIVCTTNTGSNIQVANSQTGASYQLRDGVTNVGAPVNGTGGTISLPTGTLSASTTFNVFASLGATCSAQLTATATVTVTSGPDISLGVTASSGSVCANTGTNIQVANSQNGASYQLRNGTTAVGAAVTGTGGTINLPTGNLSVNTTFNVFVTIGTCSAQLTATAGVTILPSTDPSCGGGPGTGTCVNLSFVPVPTAATCSISNGSIFFNLNNPVPVASLNKHGVIINIVGTNTPFVVKRTQKDNFIFTALPAGTYSFKIQYGDSTQCVFPGFVTIDQSGTLGNVTVKPGSVVRPACSGQATGAFTPDLPLTEIGQTLEWSLDGVLWNSFVGGNPIIGIAAGLPPLYSRTISIRRGSSDPCNASVSVILQDQFTPITASITPQTSATCNNNDGSVLVAYSGGDASGSGYTFELDDKTFTMPTDKIIRNLSGGNHKLRIIDNQLCSMTLNGGNQFFVTSPGLIQFSVSGFDPTCIGNGEDGRVAGSILSASLPGTYEVAITQEQGSNSTFKTLPPSGSIEFTGLSKGTYYVTVRSSVNGCPNEQKVEILGGPSRVSFSSEMTCESGNPVLKITDIKVATPGDFTFQITKLGDVISKDKTLSQFPAGGIYEIKGDDLPSATGDYEIKLVQVQGTCTISSAVSRYTNRGVLSVNAANILPSYSDIATGGFTLTNFAGGTTPYYASIRFDSAANPVNEVGFETDLEEVDSDPSTFGYIKRYNKLHAGRYHVTVNEEGGCSVEFDIRVPIDYTFSINNIPNVFTPNGDGVNDFFFIRNLPADAQLIISNRWGNQVYSSKSYQNDWNGGSAADGIYYYRLKAGDEVVTGWIEIQRGK